TPDRAPAAHDLDACRADVFRLFRFGSSGSREAGSTWLSTRARLCLDEHDRHVVWRTERECLIDQSVDGALQRGAAQENSLDVVVFDVPTQTVRAQQPQIAWARIKHLGVDVW